MFHNLLSIISFKTFRDERNEWKRFGTVLCSLVGGTLIFLAAVLEFINWRVGENISYTDAAAEQVRQPDLLWDKGDSYHAGFKLIRLAQVRPEVLIMGQSRMNQFRSRMFYPYSCYNFSKLSWSFGVYAQLWQEMPVDYKPKIVFFSLDFFNLNARYLADYADTLSASPQSPLLEHLAELRDVYNLFYIDPELILAGRHNSEGRPCIGVQAACYNDGVRWDGSEQLSPRALKTAGRNSDLFNTVHLGNQPVYYGDAVSSEEMAKFEKFIAMVHASGATVVGIQMPIYGPAMRAIEKDPHYGILKDFRDRISSGYFDRQGVIVFDYSKLSPYSDDYRYFIDAFHPTEPVCAAVVFKMSSDPRIKAVLPNLQTISLQHKLEENQTADQHVYLYYNEF